MATSFVNCYPSESLTPLGYYRIAVKLGWLESFATDYAKNYQMQQVYNAIRDVAPLIPNSPYSYAAGDDGMVVDCTAGNNAAGTTCAAAASAINNILFAVGMVSFEKLVTAPSPNAPAERAGVVAAINTESGPLGSLTATLNGLGDGLKYLVIAAVLWGGVVLLKDIKEWT